MKQAPIAVIGMGCRFPGGANTPEEFWAVCRDGVDTITEVPAERWDKASYYTPEYGAKNKIISNALGVVEPLYDFDVKSFNMKPRMVQAMDPQQRWLLESTWEAIESAGLPLEAVKGPRTAVFMGCYLHDYWFLLGRDPELNSNIYSGFGNLLSGLAGRIAYVFDCQGPAEVVDTACSSSLVSVHRACQALRTGECDIAIAGGANAVIAPESSIYLSVGMVLSPDGCCKTFDESANGYVRGDGAGVVLLKMLDQAVADGDRIMGVIAGSSVNHGGHGDSYSAPNENAQARCHREALSNAGIACGDVGYVEAHGTGTTVGDPLELNALKACYDATDSVLPLYVGSVKANIGHTESAAGIAGLIKSIYAVKEQQVPANIHLNTLNHRVDLTDSRIVLPTSRVDLSSAPIEYAGISSFGITGTNCHMIIQKPALKPANKAVRTVPASAFVFSAQSKESLDALLQRMEKWLSTTEAAFEDIAYSLACCRSHFKYRVACQAADVAELITILPTLIGAHKKTALSDTLEPVPNDVDQQVSAFCGGAKLDWQGHFADTGCMYCDLPHYVFVRKRYTLLDKECV